MNARLVFVGDIIVLVGYIIRISIKFDLNNSSFMSEYLSALFVILMPTIIGVLVSKVLYIFNEENVRSITGKAQQHEASNLRMQEIAAIVIMYAYKLGKVYYL